MASISSIGLSGLPLDQLLTDLRKNENQALSVIKNRQTDAESKISAYGKLKDAVAAMQKAAEAVGKEDAFGAVKVKTGSDAISASASNNAIAGHYSINVKTLASAQTMVFAGQASRTDDIGSGGKLNITIDGETKSLQLSSGTSLEDIVSAINSDKDIGVDATIVNDGSDSPFRLLFTSRATGEVNSITSIEVEGNTELNDFLAYDIDSNPSNNGNQGFSVQAATNAEIEVNGIEITSASNTIEDVIDGVKLDLNSTTDDKTISLDLTKDTEATKKAINNFVSAYNKMLDTIKSLTSYDIENQKASALTGDSTARSIQSNIRGAISGSFDPSSNTNLSQIGITTDPTTGQLKVDDKLLDKALADNPDGIKNLFTSKTGLAANVGNAAEAFTRSGGIISTRTDGLNRTIKNIQSQYEAAAQRIDQRMETYRKQFTQLDSMVSQMNSMSDYLTQQFEALANINPKK